MLTPPDPTGTILTNTRPMVVKVTLASGDTSATVTIPGPGLAFYVPYPIMGWNCNGWWISSHGQGSCVIEFATPAPASGEMFVLLFH